jgi:hypothetical protein
MFPDFATLGYPKWTTSRLDSADGGGTSEEAPLSQAEIENVPANCENFAWNTDAGARSLGLQEFVVPPKVGCCIVSNHLLLEQGNSVEGPPRNTLESRLGSK